MGMSDMEAEREMRKNPGLYKKYDVFKKRKKTRKRRKSKSIWSL